MERVNDKERKWFNGDGTYRIAVAESVHDAQLLEPPSAWAKRLFTHEITVNSQPKIVRRGRERHRAGSSNHIGD
jgi:hypothetical protein